MLKALHATGFPFSSCSTITRLGAWLFVGAGLQYLWQRKCFCDELCNDRSLQGIKLSFSRSPNFHLLQLLPKPGKLYQCKYNQACTHLFSTLPPSPHVLISSDKTFYNRDGLQPSWQYFWSELISTEPSFYNQRYFVINCQLDTQNSFLNSHLFLHLNR